MKKSILKTSRFILFLGLAVLLLYFAFRGIDLTEMWYNFRTAHYGWILFSLFFGLLAFLSRAYRWTLLIEPLGYRPPYSSTYHSLMIGYLANYAFPRIGEITRCGVLSRTEKIPADKLFGTVIIERAIDMLMVLILLFVLVIGRFDFFGNFLQDTLFTPLWNSLVAFSQRSILFWLIAASLILLFAAFMLYLFRLKPDANPFMIRIRKIIKGILSGVQSVYKMKRAPLFLLHTVVIWTAYWLMSWVAIYVMPATSDLKLIDGLFILVIGSFGFIAPVQGGIGAFHWIVSVGLTLYGISKEDGLAFATILHGSQSIWTIFLGSLSLFLLFLKRRKKIPLITDHEALRNSKAENRQL